MRRSLPDRDRFGPIRLDLLGVRALVVPERFGGILDAPGARRPAYSAILAGKFLVVTELATGTVGRVRAPVLGPEDRALLEDVRVDLNASLMIIRWHLPNLVSWEDQAVTVIQNGPATHAFVLPTAGLADGTYRLDDVAHPSVVRHHGPGRARQRVRRRGDDRVRGSGLRTPVGPRVPNRDIGDTCRCRRARASSVSTTSGGAEWSPSLMSAS